MIASRRERRLRWIALASLLCALAGCRTTGAPPAAPLEALPRRAAIVPESADHAAADLAAAVLLGRPGADEIALVRLESIEAVRREDGGAPSGLEPVARDLVNAGLDSDVRYREATRELLAGEGELDPALRTRLERSVSDDPLELAEARLADARWAAFGRVFNGLVAPLARAATSGYAAGISVLRAVIALAVAQHEEPEISLPERQALAQWIRFVEENPRSPEAVELLERIEASQARWSQVRRDEAVLSARRALERGQPRVAVIQAERALRYAHKDSEAAGILETAQTQLLELRELQTWSSSAEPGGDIAPDAALPLARALFVGSDASAEEAERILAGEPDGGLADEARFVAALVAAEGGDEIRGFELLEAVADSDGANMARHAQALLLSPEQNPYWAFGVARGHDRGRRARWILLGPLANGPRDRNLPRVVEWLIDLPTFVEAFGSFPNRLIAYPWLSPWPFGRSPAAYGELYLDHHPEGAHADEVRGWLIDYEERRGNWVRALALSERGGADEEALQALREKASAQILAAAQRERRRDVRVSLLREVGAEYPETQAAADAAEALVRLQREATPQSIRISRGFLEENRRVAGPEGLGLRAELLDGELRNGELHKRGVTLVGGRVIDLHFIPETGGQSDEPERVRQKVSAERLARIVAILDETELHNALVDRDDHYDLDAKRDRFFERARLGLANEPDLRATAESTYSYLGMRERYGLVRGRESVLPVELVIQGSLSSLSLGAFPRVRMPKPTPDAPLFE